MLARARARAPSAAETGSVSRARNEDMAPPRNAP